MRYLKTALTVLRVLDENGNVSISNLMPLLTGLPVVLAELQKLYSEVVVPAQGGDWVMVGLFGFAMLNYLGKRYVGRHPENAARIVELEARIKELGGA